ncbi:MAG: hypothetical protein WC447_02480 [Candidatus Paceibacterota bacterium]|jgi:hypothetical protein
MNKKTIIYVIVGIIVLVGMFFIGMSYGKNSTSGMKNVNGFGADIQNQAGQFGMNNKNNKNISGGIVSGEIISKDEKSATVKLIDGGSKIIFFDTNTVVSKMTTGSLTDLATNTEISITGTTNSDGSITAKSIQIRPQIKPITPSQ